MAVWGPCPTGARQNRSFRLPSWKFGPHRPQEDRPQSKQPVEQQSHSFSSSVNSSFRDLQALRNAVCCSIVRVLAVKGLGFTCGYAYSSIPVGGHLVA